MATITMHKLKLDAVHNATNTLVLRLPSTTADLPSPYTFYTSTYTTVELTVTFPVPGASLCLAGTTYADSDNNNSVIVQFASPGDHEIELFLPSSTTATSAETAGGEPNRYGGPRAPGIRCRLVPKIGYPPTGDGDT
jgi:hypothetical protein